MTWFKVDDKLWGHPKWLATPIRSRGLWVTAGAWAADHEQDGNVPRHLLPIFGATARDASGLVASGLWEATDAGWRFRNWDEFQPTREQKEAERAAARERMRAGRARKAELLSESVQPNTAEVRPQTERTSAEVRSTPSRPVPTRPEGEEGGKESSDRPLPDDWRPNDKHAQTAAEHGLDLDDLEATFRNHARDENRRAKNWNLAFTAWIKKRIELNTIDRSTADFDAFWAVYPRRTGKGNARTAWTKALRKTDAQTLIRAAEHLRDDPNREDQYTPHATTWLNGERWEDDPLPARSTRSADPRGDLLRREMANAVTEEAAREISPDPFAAYAHLEASA